MAVGKVVVLGSAGMLGQMCCWYFSRQGDTVYEIRERVQAANALEFASGLNALRPDVVINCIVSLPRTAVSAADLYFVNAVLPGILAMTLDPGILLVQPSTDGIYDGCSAEPYRQNAPGSFADPYGASKSFCEILCGHRENVLIPRTSIVGPDKRPSANGLMAWLIAHSPGQTVNGYANHFWNGITSHAWCRVVTDLLSRGDRGVKVLASNQCMSKAELLQAVNIEFGLGLIVRPVFTETVRNRCLDADVCCGSITGQLADLHAHLPEFIGSSREP